MLGTPFISGTLSRVISIDNSSVSSVMKDKKIFDTHPPKAITRSSSPPFWEPAVDIYQDGQGWLVKMELAGVKAEDINLSLSGNALKVSGTRRDEVVHEGHKAYSMEISYNRFERILEVPSFIHNPEIKHKFQDGMLLITINTEKES